MSVLTIDQKELEWVRSQILEIPGKYILGLMNFFHDKEQQALAVQRELSKKLDENQNENQQPHDS